MKPKKYICPHCNKEISTIRYVAGETICYGITVKCPKCNEIVPVKINCDKISIKL